MATYLATRSSVGEALQEIKDQFLSTATAQAKWLNRVASEDFSGLTTVRRSFTTGRGVYFEIQPKTNEFGLVTSFDWSIDAPAGTIAEQRIQAVGVNAPLNRLSDPEECPIAGVSWPALWQDVSAGTAYNAAIGKITDALCGDSEMTFADAVGLISGESTLTTIDYESILAALRASTLNGKITALSWMQCMQEMFRTAKSAVDRGTLELDTTKPFIVQSFLSTLVDGLAAGLSVLLTNLSSVLGGLMFALSSVISVVLSKFVNVSNSLQCIPGLLTNYVNGPVKYAQDSHVWVNLDAPDVFCVKYGCFDVYYIKNGDHYAINAFLSLQYDSAKAWKKLSKSPKLEILDREYGPIKADIMYYRYRLDEPYIPSALEDLYGSLINDPSMYYSLDQTIAMMADPKAVAVNLYEGICAIQFLTHCVQTVGSYTAFKVDFNSTYGWISTYQYDHVAKMKGFSGDDYFWTMIMPILMFARTYHSYDITNIPDPDFGAVSESTFVEWIQAWYTHFVSNVAASTALGETKEVKVFAKAVMRVDPFIGLDADVLNYRYVDAIPTVRAITIPSITTDAIRTAAILTAIACAGTAFIGSRVMRYMQVRKQLRQTRRISELNALRDAYANNPTDTSARRAYAKALTQYNWRASILGWGSYDAANGWVNERSSITSSLNTGGLSNLTNTSVEKLANDILISIRGSVN